MQEKNNRTYRIEKMKTNNTGKQENEENCILVSTYMSEWRSEQMGGKEDVKGDEKREEGMKEWERGKLVREN